MTFEFTISNVNVGTFIIFKKTKKNIEDTKKENVTKILDGIFVINFFTNTVYRPKLKADNPPKTNPRTVSPELFERIIRDIPINPIIPERIFLKFISSFNIIQAKKITKMGFVDIIIAAVEALENLTANCKKDIAIIEFKEPISPINNKFLAVNLKFLSLPVKITYTKSSNPPIKNLKKVNCNGSNTSE